MTKNLLFVLVFFLCPLIGFSQVGERLVATDSTYQQIDVIAKKGNNIKLKCWDDRRKPDVFEIITISSDKFEQLKKEMQFRIDSSASVETEVWEDLSPSIGETLLIDKGSIVVVGKDNNLLEVKLIDDNRHPKEFKTVKMTEDKYNEIKAKYNLKAAPPPKERNKQQKAIKISNIYGDWVLITGFGIDNGRMTIKKNILSLSYTDIKGEFVKANYYISTIVKTSFGITLYLSGSGKTFTWDVNFKNDDLIESPEMCGSLALSKSTWAKK